MTARTRRLKDRFCVEVTSNTMTPRYLPGEWLTIDPSLSIRKGDFILVTTGDDVATVCQMISRTKSKIIIRQLNPETTIELRAAEVAQVYAVAGCYRPTPNSGERRGLRT